MLDCTKIKIQKKWPGARITFGFLNCPLCQTMIQHESLNQILAPFLDLYEEVKKKSLLRLKYESLDQSEEIQKETGKFYKNELGFALHNFAYYICFKCQVKLIFNLFF